MIKTDKNSFSSTSDQSNSKHWNITKVSIIKKKKYTLARARKPNKKRKVLIILFKSWQLILFEGKFRVIYESGRMKYGDPAVITERMINVAPDKMPQNYCRFEIFRPEPEKATNDTAES